jgi:hypothetical protein
LDEPPSENANKDLTDRNYISLAFKEEIIPYETAKLPLNQLISITPQEINNLLQKSKSPEQNLTVMKVNNIYMLYFITKSK